MTDSMIAAKAADNFTTESPIRAFTDFKVNGLYAIGKGFRPSLTHLGAYLDAMESKEGWEMMQIILPRDGDGDPTILFHKSAVEMMPLLMAGEIDDSPHLAGTDDPVNPKHYDGTACAEIGERMSANCYQVLKYNWRLGKKDDIVVELGKALWYLDRENALIDAERQSSPDGGLSMDFVKSRLVHQDEWVRSVAASLYHYTLSGERRHLDDLRCRIVARRLQADMPEGMKA